MDTFIIVVQLLTPFAVLWLGWYYNRQQKKAQESKDAEQKVEALEREKTSKEIQDALDAIKVAQKQLEDTNSLVRSFQGELSSIIAANNLNGQCTGELAQLVMVLAEGLRDQHLDGNITRAIDKYRKFESEKLKDIMTGCMSGASKSDDK